MKLDLLETTDPAVDAIVAAYFDELDRGAPSRAEWLAQHAEYAAELGRFLDDLECLSPGRDDAAKAATRTAMKGSAETLAPAVTVRQFGGAMADPQFPEKTVGTPAKSAATLTEGIFTRRHFWRLPIAGNGFAGRDGDRLQGPAEEA